jgi:hypothetical protein
MADGRHGSPTVDDDCAAEQNLPVTQSDDPNRLTGRLDYHRGQPERSNKC